ncbi:MAG: response regulator transcription factor [Bacteroidales bacterium]|nr:response regulator transcription factor [Bacteroidales bacterium]
MSDKITIMIVDDEPIIRKAIKYEINGSHAMVDCRLDDDGRVEQRELEVIGSFADGPQLFAALNSSSANRPDYLLVDMEFQGEPTGGIAITDRVRRQFKKIDGSDIKIIILSGRFDNPARMVSKPKEMDLDRQTRIKDIGSVVFEALGKGANAFVSKNAVGGFSIENIVRAISCLERGERYYFNYPVMLTLMEAAELYFERERHDAIDEPVSDEEREILLHEAAGCTAQEIAQRLTQWNESEKAIQEKQKELSRKFNIVNKSGARIAKAIQHGLISPGDIKYLKR